MNFAAEHLNFIIWHDSQSISYKKIHKMQYRYRKNLKMNIGEYIYCTSCGKKVMKIDKSQVTCGCKKCDNKIKAYIAYDN